MEPLRGVLVGVDVGGTYTAAVLMQGSRIITHCKTITTPDITQGITEVFQTLFTKHPDFKEKVHSINIGTTHLVNALAQGQGFNKTLVIRLAAPLTDALPPTVDWSEEAKNNQGKCLDRCLIIKGGYEYKADEDPSEPKEVSPLDVDEIRKLAQETFERGTQAVAITGLFSPIKPDQEKQAEVIFKEINPALKTSLSNRLGTIGLLRRENAAIFDACFYCLLEQILKAFKEAIRELNISTKNVFFTLGNGTRKRIDATRISPLRTLDSGSINSAKGAVFLAKVENAVTVDIGGTSTDLGIVRKGMPLSENAVFSRGGIDLSFSAFRFRSYALGGGTYIKFSDGKIVFGPESVGNELREKSLAYGGHILTPTDIAFYLGRIELEGKHLPREAMRNAFQHFLRPEDIDRFIKEVDEAIHQKFVEDIEDFLGTLDNIPPHLILVGGGAKLFDPGRLKRSLQLQRFQSIEIPEFGETAGAVGAARSWIGATYTRIYSLATKNFVNAERKVIKKAKKKAIQKGADGKTIRIIDLEQTPLSYLPDKQIKFKVTVVGEDREVEILKPNREEQFERPFLSEIKQVQIRKEQETVKTLTVEDIEDIALGSGLLGSGGGGDTDLARLMTINAINNGKEVKIISLNELQDTARVVICVGVGSPKILYERLFTSHEGKNVLKNLKAKLGQVDAVISGECGGTNGIYPLVIGANEDILIVDADCAGRCLPQLQMMLPNIYGEIKNTPFALSNGLEEKGDVAKDLPDLENKARGLVMEMGGVVSMAIVPMTGAEVKKWTIEGTLSILQKMGAALRENKKKSFQEKLDVLNEILLSTEYKMARVIGEGKICGHQQDEKGGFSTGGFLVKNPDTGEIIEVGYQNENLVARHRGSVEGAIEVPHLITIVEKGTFSVISCEKIREGLENVAVLTLTAPEKLTTKEALKFVGPEAYPFEELLKFLSTLKDPDSFLPSKEKMRKEYAS
jgi:DUF917 family protein